jgi:hypothetical protein
LKSSGFERPDFVSDPIRTHGRTPEKFEADFFISFVHDLVEDAIGRGISNSGLWVATHGPGHPVEHSSGNQVYIRGIYANFDAPFPDGMENFIVISEQSTMLELNLDLTVGILVDQVTTSG